jgi:hypothetical protein
MRQQEAAERHFQEEFPPMARHVKFLKERGTTGRSCAFPGSRGDGLDETESREMRAFYLAFSFQGESAWLLFHILLGFPA